LVVTNGHVDDTGEPGRPFQQPPQVFANLGDHFQLMKVSDPSHYFGSDHVGRALARLDFNRDGKSDFVVTHLESPSALLINRTETNNHWLQVQLVGTQCERDAIGAKIGVRCGDQQWTGWVTAGDGYLCHNESIVSFGLGGSAELAELVVTWPTGEQQHFKSVAIDHRILIVQGQATVFPL